MFKSFILWVKDLFHQEPFCNHKNSEWFLIDMGMNKAEICKDCGKIMRTLDKDFR